MTTERARRRSTAKRNHETMTAENVGHWEVGDAVKPESPEVLAPFYSEDEEMPTSRGFKFALSDEFTPAGRRKRVADAEYEPSMRTKRPGKRKSRAAALAERSKTSRQPVSLGWLVKRKPSQIPDDIIHVLTLDDYVTYLAEVSPNLSPSEIEVSKNHRKRISNREAANLSRVRKQDHLDGLHRTVAELKRENAQLREYKMTLARDLADAHRELQIYQRLLDLNNMMESRIKHALLPLPLQEMTSKADSKAHPPLESNNDCLFSDCVYPSSPI